MKVYLAKGFTWNTRFQRKIISTCPQQTAWVSSVKEIFFGSRSPYYIQLINDKHANNNNCSVTFSIYCFVHLYRFYPNAGFQKPAPIPNYQWHLDIYLWSQFVWLAKENTINCHSKAGYCIQIAIMTNSKKMTVAKRNQTKRKTKFRKLLKTQFVSISALISRLNFSLYEMNSLIVANNGRGVVSGWRWRPKRHADPFIKCVSVFMRL